MTFETFWPELQPMVDSIAAEFGRKNHQYGADAADYAQELCIYLIENEDQVVEWLEEYEPKHFDRFLARVLRNECIDYSRDVRSQTLGYERRDEFFYSKNEVKALLPAMFDPEKWLEPPQSEGRSTKAPAEGGNWIATLADLSRAFDQLSLDDQVMLRSFHQEGRMNIEMADAYKVSESTMSYRHDQAVKRLVTVLGGEVPRPSRSSATADPWRGRHAIGRAHAMAIQSSYYEEQ